MIAGLLLLLADPAAADLMTRAATRFSVAEPAPRDPAERFRVGDDDMLDGPSGKDRAVGETGARCSVVGARVCTRPPRTWIKAPLSR